MIYPSSCRERSGSSPTFLFLVDFTLLTVATSAEEILKCEEAGITVTLPKPMRRNGLGRPLEFHGVHGFTAVERCFGRRRCVSENTAFDLAKAYLLSAGPTFVPTHIEMVDHSVGFDGIGSRISKHRVVKSKLFRGGLAPQLHRPSQQ